jgi:hypothetical protein
MNTRRTFRAGVVGAVVAAACALVAPHAQAAAGAGSGPATASAAPSAAEDATTYRTAAGRWTSTGCESAGATSVTRDFLLAGRSWSVSAQVHGDGACTTKLLTFSATGTYRLGRGSEAVPGAREARFGFDRKQVTPFTQEIVDVLNANGCGGGEARIGVTEDVSRTGCAPLGITSNRDCPAEFDLLRRDGDRLFLGARPADGDLCSAEKRPTQLAPALELR